MAGKGRGKLPMARPNATWGTIERRRARPVLVERSRCQAKGERTENDREGGGRREKRMQKRWENEADNTDEGEFG